MTKKTLLVEVLGHQLDLVHAMVSAKNIHWKELTIQTGLGPFAVSKKFKAVDRMSEVFPTRNIEKGETEAEFAAREALLADQPVPFNEVDFIEVITALIFLALRSKGVEITYEKVERKVGFFEAFGALQQIGTFQAAQEAQENAESDPPTQAPMATDQGANGAEPLTAES